MITDNSWLCDIRYKGCKENAATSWVCQVESIQISACIPCQKVWREKVRSNPQLDVRCPRCERSAGPTRLTATRPDTEQPLQGIIADALESAMFSEGVLINVRRRVLLRLARENPWLDGWGTSSVPDAVPVEQAG